MADATQDDELRALLDAYADYCVRADDAVRRQNDDARAYCVREATRIKMELLGRETTLRAQLASAEAALLVPRTINADLSITCDGCGEAREPHTWRDCHALMDKRRGDAIEAWAEACGELATAREQLGAVREDALVLVEREEASLRSIVLGMTQKQYDECRARVMRLRSALTAPTDKEKNDV